MREFTFYLSRAYCLLSVHSMCILLSSSLSHCRRTLLKLTLSESEKDERNSLRPTQRAVSLIFSETIRTSKS